MSTAARKPGELKPQRRAVSVRLPLPVYMQLLGLAAQLGRPMADIVAEWIDDGLKSSTRRAAA